MRLLQKIFRRNHYPKSQHEVKYAFTCGGVDYFQFPNFNNIPALRGLKTIVFYEEMRCRCTREFLQLHVEAVNKLLTSEKISIYKIKELNDQLDQRLNIAVDTELLYKIATVVFFDKQENISDYDFAYNAKKVAHWKKHQANEFFFLKPVQELFPVLNDIDENFLKYSQVVEQLNQMHLGNLLQHLPTQKTKQLKNKSYFSAVIIPQ